MIDIHSHVLPNVDDGSKSPEESRQMFEGYAELGYTRVVATPHWAVGVPDVSEAIISSTTNIASEVGIQLSIARECRIHPNLREHVEANPMLRVDGGDVVLVELPWGPTPAFTVPVFQALVKSGFRPVLVHPERHGNLWKQGFPLDSLANQGVPLQINILSLTGQHGKGSRDRAIALLEEGMVSLVASDLHAANEMDAQLPEALALLENLVGPEVATVLTTRNPRALLANKPLEPVGPIEIDISAIHRSGGILSQIKNFTRLWSRTSAR